jgi:translocation and assembly module TamB
MRRLLLIISGLLILLAVAVPSAGLYYVVFTESGLQFLLKQVPHRIGGVQLDIVNARGTLAHGIRIERVDVEHDRVHVRVEGLEGRVALLPLLLQTIRTHGAVIRSVYVEVRRRKKPPEPSPPFFLPHWLIISADRARIGSAVVVAPNGTRISATDLSGSAMLRHRSIRFFEASAQMGDLRYTGIGALRAEDPLQIDGDGRVDWSPAGQPAWSVAGTAHGDLNSLALTGRFIAPFSANVEGRALDLTGRWHLEGTAQVHSFDLGEWGLHTPLGILKAQLALSSDANGFSARGSVVPTGLNVGAFNGEFDGSYADRVLTVKRVDLTHGSSAAHATGSGTIGIVPNGPRLDLKGTWQDFRWPLVGREVPFRSSSGEYAIEGTLPYSVQASGLATVTDLPQMPAQVNGTLGKDRFEFKMLSLDAFDGHADLNGEVVWSPGQTWIVNGDITGMTLARFREDLPGAISFAMASQGQGFSDKGDFTVEIRNLSGKLRGVAASGGGRLTRSARQWEFDGVRIGLGRTRIALDGSVTRPVKHAGGGMPDSGAQGSSALADEIDLRFGVKAEDLSLISAGSSGQLQANGTIRGTLQDPTVSAVAHGTGIHHEGVTLEALDANIDFDPRAGHSSKVEAQLRKLQLRNRILDSLHFSLEGPAASFAVHLEAQAPGLALVAEGRGPYAHGVWDGQLDQLTVSGTQSLHLELERPVGVLVSAQHVRDDWMCLVGTPASLCADADWTPAAWSTTFTANDLPMSTLTSGLTPSVEYSGRISALVRLSGGETLPPQGTVRLDLTDAELAHRSSSGKIENTTLGSGRVTVTATRSTVEAEVGLDAGKIGTIKGSLTAQRMNDDWASMPVLGELHAHTEDLGLVTLYVPEIDRAAGTLNAELQFKGTLGSPLVDGTLTIANGEIDFYQVNLALRQVGFQARLSERGLDFEGTTHIGQGTAASGGHLEWRESLPYGTFKLQGDGLRVVDVPEAQINASPMLDFRIDGRRIEVTGEVKVPYAKIVPADLKGAVLASSDETIVGAERPDPAKRFQVMSTITLTLGDKVSLDTSGLSGRLGGNITVRSGYDEVTRATGELSIEEGKYIAYARKLDIQRGRLIFTGGPIQDPGIDLRAVKEFPDVTAGINVRGTLQQPHMSFFSDPSLPQSQIVSLILSGGGLESVRNPGASGAGNEALAQGGAILAQQLGSRIGIEDVSLETDLTNETSLVLGKFLSPRLYVSYGVSLTEQLNTFKLRYTLGDHWTVKTEVGGQARGADLVFTIDK